MPTLHQISISDPELNEYAAKLKTKRLFSATIREALVLHRDYGMTLGFILSELQALRQEVKNMKVIQVSEQAEEIDEGIEYDWMGALNDS